MRGRLSIFPVSPRIFPSHSTVSVAHVIGVVTSGSYRGRVIRYREGAVGRGDGVDIGMFKRRLAVIHPQDLALSLIIIPLLANFV